MRPRPLIRRRFLLNYYAVVPGGNKLPTAHEHVRVSQLRQTFGIWGADEAIGRLLSPRANIHPLLRELLDRHHEIQADILDRWAQCYPRVPVSLPCQSGSLGGFA